MAQDEVHGDEQELLALELDLNDDGEDSSSISETPRQARVRRAIEAAKQHYQPVVEDDSWFLSQEITHLLQVSVVQASDGSDDEWKDCCHVHIEADELDSCIQHQLRVDKRASHKLDWTLSALYGNHCPKAALSLALALLRTAGWPLNHAALSALPSTGDVSTWHLDPASSSSASPPKDPTAKKGKAHCARDVEFGFGKESLDIALRSAKRLLELEKETEAAGHQEEGASSDARRLALLLAHHALQVVPHEGLRQGVWDGSREVPGGWQEVHWTNTPGLALSLGHLCSELEHWRAATIAYAVYTGTRGPLRVPARCTAIALARLADTSAREDGEGHDQEPPSRQGARAACIALAQAFAAAHLGATVSGKARENAVAEVRRGAVLPVRYLAPSATLWSSLGMDADGSEDDAQDEDGSTERLLGVLLADARQSDSASTSSPRPGSLSLSPPLLPPESAIALVRCGPARKTPMKQCVERLGAFLVDGGAGDGHGQGRVDEDDGRVQIRSVRTL